jgi:hypothetical protein
MTKKITPTGIYIIVILFLVFDSGFQNASATPILGQQLFYEGGPIEITVLPYDAGYTNELYLFSTATRLPIASNTEVGRVVILPNLQSLGVAVGDELLFGIVVTDTGNTFLIGPASRNIDNFAHATVDYAEGANSDVAELTFEDLLWGGDADYNDAIFRLRGGIGLERLTEAVILATPEPASVILLVLGLAGLASVFRRKKQS